MLASSLRHDVARVQQVLAQHTPPAPGTEVHPFFLRNEIAKFDETRQCDELQQQANKLVRRQLVYQVVVYPTGLLAFHLGVPAAIVFPFALLASAGGLGFMRLRWGVARSRFWGQVDAGYKSLRSKLLFAYTEELKRVGTTPVTAIIQMLEDTIDARLKDLARNEKERQRLQAILRQLQQ
ncbi:hypothetical protein DFS34DRAFT_583317 [Phlyctochytrium arcticum]|nr:hypothetical protein DFS34DRAFT_583317 [Phlyctochytrium arcticum]